MTKKKALRKAIRREIAETRNAPFLVKTFTPITVTAAIAGIAVLTYNGIEHHAPGRYYLFAYLIVVAAFILRALVWW